MKSRRGGEASFPPESYYQGVPPPPPLPEANGYGYLYPPPNAFPPPNDIWEEVALLHQRDENMAKIRDICSGIRQFLVENAQPDESLAVHFDKLKSFAGLLIHQVNSMDERMAYSNGPSAMSRTSYDGAPYHPPPPSQGGSMNAPGRGNAPMGGPSPYHSHPPHYGPPTNHSQDPYRRQGPANYYHSQTQGGPGNGPPPGDYHSSHPSHPSQNGSGSGYPVVRPRAPGGRVSSSNEPGQRPGNQPPPTSQDYNRMGQDTRASSHELSQQSSQQEHSQAPTGPQPPPPMQMPMMPYQYSNNSQSGLNDFPLSSLDTEFEDQFGDITWDPEPETQRPKKKRKT